MDSVIYVAGHTGMVGSAIMRRLKARGDNNIVVRTSKELDLRDRSAVNAFFNDIQPDFVYLAAAKVGGIFANDAYPAEFLFDNIAIASNVIDAAHKFNVKKLLFLGSSCIYPRLAPQPISEEDLLTGSLEPTNEPYALAKIAGLKLCDAYRKQYGCNFISAMPTNLYGPGDNYHPENSHVLPSLIRRFNEAVRDNLDKVECWGSGKAKREFLHVDDLADALLFMMDNFNSAGWVNVGTGVDLSIQELAENIAEITGYKGEIVWDTSKPDGAPRKLLNVDKMSKLGWSSKIALNDGLKNVCKAFLKSKVND